jgi:hypothetical protein
MEKQWIKEKSSYEITVRPLSSHYWVVHVAGRSSY